MIIFAGGGGEIMKMLARPFKLGLVSRYYSYFLNKVIWVYFSHQRIFRKEHNIGKTRKLPPDEKFPSLEYFLHNVNNNSKKLCMVLSTIHWPGSLDFLAFSVPKIIKIKPHHTNCGR